MHHAFCLVQPITKTAKYIILLNTGRDCKEHSANMLIHTSSTVCKVCCCLAAVTAPGSILEARGIVFPLAIPRTLQEGKILRGKQDSLSLLQSASDNVPRW